MQRLFAQPFQIDEENHHISITGEDVNHIKNVLRMKPEDEVWVSDGENKEYHCRIQSLCREEVLLEILYVQETDYELPGKLCLFQGLPKGDKMELIIQKAVELGVSQIIPVETKRCVVRLDEKKAEKKTARWQEIAKSAAKQSKRMKIPKVGPVMSLKEALSYAGELDVCLIPYELARGMEETKKIIQAIQPGESIGIFIGPEGGFAPEEVEAAAAIGAKSITLGRRILRTETAGLAILSVLMFRLEGEEPERN